MRLGLVFVGACAAAPSAAPPPPAAPTLVKARIIVGARWVEIEVRGREAAKRCDIMVADELAYAGDDVRRAAVCRNAAAADARGISPCHE